MTRRLLFAGTAFTASLLPACMAPQLNSEAQRPSVHPAVVAKTTTGGVLVSKTTRKSESFAEIRTEAPLTLTKNTVPFAGTPPVPEGPALTEFIPVEHKAPEITPPMVVEAAKPIATPVEKNVALPDPIPDAEGIIRARDPVIRIGALPLVETPTTIRAEPLKPIPTRDEVKSPANVSAPTIKPAEVLAPKFNIDDAPPVLAPTPKLKPAVLPPGVIGSSVHPNDAALDLFSLDPKLSPVPTDVGTIQPVSATGESPLLQAVRAYQQKRPEDAVDHLKACDPASQQMLLSLMPALVRLSEGKLAQMKPEEMDMLLDLLTQAPNPLRSKASLKASNMRLCREVHNFAHVEPFPEKHTFRPGDIVYLYLELSNFSCVGDPKSGYFISLMSNLELLDAANKVVWKAEPKEEPDRVSTPPQDYYRNFRLCVPNVPQGDYKLRVNSTDQPTGRVLDKSIEMRIGSK
ncbi:MAG: hypothetical protein EXS09_00810 [Gemmataceae bacterium]|nr:hypothetical protein [Gemmataceae bacterium]